MPHVEIPAAEVKVVLLGSSHTGKSSLVTRFSEGYYRENSRQPTVGAAFVTKRVQTSDEIACKVQLWDTAGADSFKQMAPMFYRDAAAVIVCYDVGCRKSFDEMRGWLDELRLVSSSGEMVVAIAALKADLLMHHNEMINGASQFVPELEVQQLAEALGVIYLPTSAKMDQNVTALFQRVADQVLQNRRDRIRNKSTKLGETSVNNRENHPSRQLKNSGSLSIENTFPGRGSPKQNKHGKHKINTVAEITTPSTTPRSGRKRETKINVGSHSKMQGSKIAEKRDNTILEDPHTIPMNKYGMCAGCGAGESIDGGSGCIIS